MINSAFKFRLTRLLALWMLAVLTMLETAPAATWTGATADLNTASNWTPIGVPGNSVAVDFTGSGNNNPTLAASFQGAGSGIGAMTLTSGQSSPLTITNAGAAGIVYRFGGGFGITMNAGAGALTFGDGAGAANSFIINMGTGTSNFINNSSSVGTFTSDIQLNASGGTSPTVAFSGTGDWVHNGTFTNNLVTVTKTGSGTLTLAGASSAYTGGVGISSSNTGIVRVTNTAGLGTGTVTMNGGTLELLNNGAGNNVTITYGNNLTTNSGSTATFNVANNGANTGNTIAMGTYSIGTATVNVTGANGYGLSVGAMTTGAGAGTITLNPTTAKLTVASFTGNSSTKTLLLTGTAVGNAITGTIADGSAAVSVSKSGTGDWTLSGANAYAGGTTISGGTLKMSGVGTLGATSGALTVNTGGTLDLNGTSQSVGNFTGTGGAIVNNATGTNVNFSIGNGDGTGGNYQGVIANNTTGTGTIALTKVGTGTITLSGANTYSGTTTIAAGTLRLTNALALQNSAVTLVNSGTAATLQLRSDSNATFSSGLITIGTGGGNTTIDVGAANVGNTNHTLTMGNLKMGNSHTFTITNSTADGYSAAFGALNTTNSQPTINANTNASFTTIGPDPSSTNRDNPLTFNGTATLTVGSIVNDANLPANVTSVVKTNSGTLRITGASTYRGGTDLQAGTILANDVASLGTASVTLNGGILALHLNGAGSNGAISMNNTSWTTNSNNSITIDVANNGANTGNTINLPGNYNLGATTTLNVTGVNGYLLGLPALQLGGGGAGTSIVNPTSANVTIGTVTSSTAAHVLQLDGTSTGNSITGIISNGSGVSINKSNTSTWTLSGANAYAGGTTIGGGTLKLSGVGTLGATSGALTVNTGGTLDLNGTTQGVGNFTGTGGTIVNNATGTNVTLTIGNSNGTGGNYQGVIADHTSGTGTVALTKVGNGSITLSGANTFSGGTTINGGTVRLDNTAGAGTGLIQIGNGTLSLFRSAATTTYANAITSVLGTAGTLTVDGSGANAGNGTNSTYDTGTITVNGTLTVSRPTGGNGSTFFTGVLAGSGTLLVDNTNGGANPVSDTNRGRSQFNSSSNTFNGAVTVQNGGNFVNNTPNPSYTTVTVGANSVLTLLTTGAGDTTTSIDTLNGSGTITKNINANTATIDVGQGTFTGVISESLFGATGAVALTKSGAGTLTLSGANTYTGLTTVNGGVLTRGASNVLADGASVVVNNTAVFNSGSTAFTDTITNLTINSTGTSILNGLNITGTLNITAGNQDINSNASATAATVTMSGGSSLRLGANAGGNTTFTVGAGGLSMDTATLQLGVPGSGSTAQVNLGGNFTGSGTNAIINPNTLGSRLLDLSGATRTFNITSGLTTISPTIQNGGLIKTGAGSLTLTGANIFVGGTNLQNTNTGVLTITDPAGLSTGTVTLNGGTLAFHINGAGNNGTISLTAGNFTTNSNNTVTIDVANNGANTGNTIVIPNNYNLGANTTLNITGANGYALGISTLQLGGGGAGISLVNPTTATVTIGTVTSTGVAHTLQLDGTNTGNAITGTISNGTGVSITKSNSSTWTLSGNNSYAGATLVQQGTLEVASNNALGTTAGGTTVSNGARLLLTNTSYTTTEALNLNGSGIGAVGTDGALYATGTSRWDGNITAQSNATIFVPTGSTLALGNSGSPGVITKNNVTLTFDGGGVTTVNSQITGATDHTSDLDITGGSTVILTNINNNYMGPTNIINGTLQNGLSNVVPNGSELTFGSAGAASTYDLASFSETLRGLSSTAAGNGVVRNSVNATNSTLTLAPQGVETWTFTGAIQQNPGTVNVVMNGAPGATQRLGGVNTYTGATTVTSGTLEQFAGSLQNSSINVNGGTFLQSGGTNNVTGVGTGDLTITGAGVYSLTGGTLDFHDYSSGSPTTWTPDAGRASTISMPTGAQFSFTGGTLQDVSTITVADNSAFTQNGGTFVIGQDGTGPAALTTINGGFSLLGGIMRFDAFGPDATPEQCCDGVASLNDQVTVNGDLLLDSTVSLDFVSFTPEFGDAFTLFCADTITLGDNFGIDGGFFRVIPDGQGGFALQAIVPEPASVAVWTIIGLAGAAGAWRSRRRLACRRVA